MKFAEVWNTWAAAQDESTLSALRDAIVAEPSDPLAAREAAKFLRSGQFMQARQRLLLAMPSWFLSPSAHNLMALAQRGLGLDEAAADERALSGLGLRLVLDSGDGTRFQPWVVLRPSDEYDLCMMLGKHVVGQETPAAGLDVLRCNDSSTYWFRVHRVSERAA